MRGVFKSSLSHPLSAQLADTNKCFCVTAAQALVRISLNNVSTSKRLGGGGGGGVWWREGSSGSRRPLASEGTGGRKQVVGMSGGKH